MGISIELFSCSGGMAEGFRRAGIVFDMVVDQDPDACDSYTQNLGHRPLQMDARDLLRMVQAGWRPMRPIQLLVADPPCTPWSRAGKGKGAEDERDMLGDTSELITLLRPQVFLVGNVPGLDDAHNWPALQKTLGSIPGYCVDYQSLDAADYGVPQHRHRPFWFGHPKGTPCLKWPRPTHGAPDSIGHAALGDDRLPWVTCRQALEHLPLEELGRPTRMRVRKQNSAQHGSVPDKPSRVVGTSNLSDGNVLTHPPAEQTKPPRDFHRGHPPSTPDHPAQTVTSKDGGGEHSGPTTLLAHPRHPVTDPDEPSHTITTRNRGTQGASAMTVEGKGGYHVPQNSDEPLPTITASVPGPRSRKALTWPWDRPSTAVMASPAISPPGHHGNGEQRGPNCVVLSEKSATILQGFPEDWVFSGRTKKARWSQIGQAMPPGLAYPVAQQIMRWFRENSLEDRDE